MVNSSLLYLSDSVDWTELEAATLGREERCFSNLEQLREENTMTIETNLTIAELDVELSSVGGYDSVSGMPCGSLLGPIHPFIRPQGADDVSSLVPASEKK